jgi:hypothetical protein
MDGEEKGWNGEIYRRNEVSSRRRLRGELSNSKLLVRLEWHKINVKAREHGL